jgi:hypothetical protein
MPTDRSEILKQTLRVKSSEVQWHFIANYYDGPISGLAFFQDRLYRFCCFPEDIPDHHIYVLQELTPDELKEELRVKTKFEALVGTHWSFEQDGKRPERIMRSKESSKQFYDEERFDRRKDSCDPWARSVVAWFDTNEHKAD